MTHDELLARLEGLWHDSYKAPGYKALLAVLQIKDRPRYSDTEDDKLRSEVWNQAMFVVRETISKELL